MPDSKFPPAKKSRDGLSVDQFELLIARRYVRCMQQLYSIASSYKNYEPGEFAEYLISISRDLLPTVAFLLDNAESIASGDSFDRKCTSRFENMKDLFFEEEGWDEIPFEFILSMEPESRATALVGTFAKSAAKCIQDMAQIDMQYERLQGGKLSKPVEDRMKTISQLALNLQNYLNEPSMRPLLHPILMPVFVEPRKVNGLQNGLELNDVNLASFGYCIASYLASGGDLGSAEFLYGELGKTTIRPVLLALFDHHPDIAAHLDVVVFGGPPPRYSSKTFRDHIVDWQSKQLLPNYPVPGFLVGSERVDLRYLHCIDSNEYPDPHDESVSPFNPCLQSEFDHNGIEGIEIAFVRPELRSQPRDPAIHEIPATAFDLANSGFTRGLVRTIVLN